MPATASTTLLPIGRTGSCSAGALQGGARSVVGSGVGSRSSSGVGFRAKSDPVGPGGVEARFGGNIRVRIGANTSVRFRGLEGEMPSPVRLHNDNQA